VFMFVCICTCYLNDPVDAWSKRVYTYIHVHTYIHMCIIYIYIYIYNTHVCVMYIYSTYGPAETWSIIHTYVVHVYIIYTHTCVCMYPSFMLRLEVLWSKHKQGIVKYFYWS
jgi:hypothetical protein